MFEFLKKKITGFTDRLKERLEGAKKGGAEKAEPQEVKAADIENVAAETTAGETEKNLAETGAGTADSEAESFAGRAGEGKGETEAGGESAAEPEPLKQIAREKKTVAEEEKRALKAKTGFAEKLKGLVTGKIKISENDTREFFDSLELSLLESDVEQETASAIVAQLKKQLVGKEVSARENAGEFLKGEIRKALAEVMHTGKINLLARKEKPLKILFLGPNGAGKTTTIAKIADYFLRNGESVVLAAGDTFRAASIEQLETHGKRLGVKVVKHNYGSDPAAVAFDAVKAAEAKKIDAVLIDTAGRQETNKNLLEELKKIVRVVKPDIKIYVGEAYTGQALLQQALEFNEAIGIDAFVLTKIDADAKGGTAISLLYTLKKPILFVGTGQKYSDLKEFEPGFIIERIV